jgi:hypothetical protein
VIKGISFSAGRGNRTMANGAVVNFYFLENSVGIDCDGNDPVVRLDKDDLGTIIELLQQHRETIIAREK